MNFAVIQTGGKQYQVKKGDVLKIEKLSTETKAGEMPVVHEAGAKIIFDLILFSACLYYCKSHSEA